MRFFIGFLILCGSHVSMAGLLYSYSRLATKDLDQMSKIVQEKIKESRRVQGDRSIPLREALQAVFSRPNSDHMIEKVLPSLKSELDRRGAWEKSIRALVKEASGALKNSKNFKPEAQATYIVFLENLVSEFKPALDNEFEMSIVQQIRDAQIEISKEASSQLSLGQMKKAISPSERAKLVLEARATESKSAAENKE